MQSTVSVQLTAIILQYFASPQWPVSGRGFPVLGLRPQGCAVGCQGRFKIQSISDLPQPGLAR
jgi:hypothetical protein